jgi:UrcA family protein
VNTRILLGVTFSFAVAAAAQAAPPVFSAPIVTESGQISVAVRMSDLDLSRPDGAQVLLGRLRHAASIACGGRPSSPADLAAWQAYNACFRHSLDGAVGQVRAPLVTALYRGRDQAVASTGGPG